MTRATTPTHYFLFEDDPNWYVQILITYSQGHKNVLEKRKDDLTIEPIDTDNSFFDAKYRAYYRLTQEETNLFSGTPGSPIYVQVRVLTEDGEALASAKKQISIQDVLNDEVLK